MTREERERELLELARADFKRLHELYKQTKGVPSGTTLPAGTMASMMILAILDKEFPQSTPEK